jgi:3-ketosteroid 9alpha-monooxygenase subunit B
MIDRYHPLPVGRVVTETDDAVSIVFDIPPALVDAYAYVPGQFVTLRVDVDGAVHRRSYSMSSSPAVDPDLQVTVKRVPGGVVSNWLNDTVKAGDVLDVSVPTGVFVLDDSDDDVVAFAAGSGITPIFSIVKEALHTTERGVRLLFANRDRPSAIFGAALDELACRFSDRFVLTHHEDVADGFVRAGDVATFAAGRSDAAFYVCGPTGFMDVVEHALQEDGLDQGRIHIERFTPVSAPPPSPPPAATDSSITVTITVGKRTEVIAHRGRSTVLESARWAGLPAPSSCEAGHCATCMAKVVEGRVEMAHNEVLTPEELEEGWVLTCQSVPVTPEVRVVYEP